MSQLIEQLRRIADAQAPPKKLGFGEAPKTTRYVFCNRKHGGVWYSLNDQSQPVNIEHPALTGYIRKLEFKETIRREEKSHKLHCYIEADRMYVLESSATAHFSKGLMSAIAQVTPDELKEPITIHPQASTENGEVLFCNLYQGDRQVFAPYDDQTDWKRVAGAAKKNVELANSA
jgi:hypothetical protein